MAASETTTNLSLPKYAAGDVPSWKDDWNAAMDSIDNAIHGIDISSLTSRVTAVEQTAQTASTTATAAQGAVATLRSDVKAAKLTCKGDDDNSYYGLDIS